MDTNWLTRLSELGMMTYDAFLWPGTFIVTQFIQLAPALALKLGIDVGGAGTMLPAALSMLVWSLLFYLVWKGIKSAGLYIYYNILQARTFIISSFQTIKARKTVEATTDALKKSEVVFDDLDVEVLNTGMALAPGLALCAPELSKHLSKRTSLIQRSLEKLKNYGLLSNASGATGGYDNYQLTPSGAALISMWERQGEESE